MKFQRIENVHESGLLDIVKSRESMQLKIDDNNGWGILKYNYLDRDTFIDSDPVIQSLARECRGLIFDLETGRVLSRPLHKFFNHPGEIEETKEYAWDSHVSWYEKVDGSMVRPVWSPVKRKIVWASKSGESYLSEMVDEFLFNSPKLYERISTIFYPFLSYLTPIFEFCSNSNRIVLEYPEDRLVLLAVRNNLTGEYLNIELYRGTGLDVVACEEFRSLESLDSMIEEKDREGWVAVFLDGQRCKIKTSEYRKVHSTLSDIMSERKLFRVCLSGNVDDILPNLSESDRKEVMDYNHHVWKTLTNVDVVSRSEINEFIFRVGRDRKDVAKAINAEGIYKPYLFKLLDCLYEDRPFSDATDWLMEHLENYTLSNQTYAKQKTTYSLPDWNPSVTRFFAVDRENS